MISHERFEMQEDDREESDRPKPVSIEELLRRGMDEQLTEIIRNSIGDYLQPAYPDMMLTREEMAAFGYGPPCPCGEKGLRMDEKLCECGDCCEECCNHHNRYCCDRDH